MVGPEFKVHPKSEFVKHKFNFLTEIEFSKKFLRFTPNPQGNSYDDEKDVEGFATKFRLMEFFIQKRSNRYT